MSRADAAKRARDSIRPDHQTGAGASINHTP